MALSAVILSVNFAACSDDDEDVQGGDTSITQKYIEYQQTDDGEYTQATYDNNNRLIGFSEDGNVVWSINYDTETIRREYSYINGTVYTKDYSFRMNEHGCIIELITDGENAQFSYNDENHLIASTYDNLTKNYTETTIHTWQDGNLINSKNNIKDEYNLEKNYSSTTYYKYSTLINKGNIQAYGGAFDNSFFRILNLDGNANIFMSSGLFGKQSRNLPSQINMSETNRYGDESWTDNFTYQLDSDGFVSSVSCKSSEDEEDYTENFFYKD